MPVLSQQHIDLISDQSFLKEKRILLNDLVKHFHKVEAALQEVISKHKESLPQGSLMVTGKISRGENYKGLPYLVLDYPRFTAGNKVFIYRTMFWWGNYFLCLLVTENCGYYLSGNSAPNDLMINIGKTPWNYDLADKSWEKINDQEHQFLAISRKVDFGDIDILPELSRRTFQDIMSLLIK